jgi:hypothetical protein
VTAPLLSALVSTYRGERYLRGCLESLLAQTERDRLEVVVVDAGSPEREGELVRAFRLQHPELAIHYVRTDVREPTSEAFDRATALARGRYLTTANTDDRHHPEFAATMLAVLEQSPQYGIAYADTAITNRDNETWATNTARLRFRWPDYTAAVALSCCLFGAQPVWRRAVHQEIGGWDAALKHANDQDLFLRIARRFGAVRVDAVLGLFLQRPDSNAGSDNRAASLADACRVFRRHRQAWTLDEIVPGATAGGPFATAAAWCEVGNLCALGPYTDGELALAAYRRALEQPLTGAAAMRVRHAFAINSGCVLAAAGAVAAARSAFRLALDGDDRRHDLALLDAAGERPPTLRSMRFVVLDDPVVAASRRGAVVRVTDDGQVVAGTSRQVPWDVFEGPNGVPWSAAAGEAVLQSTR